MLRHGLSLSLLLLFLLLRQFSLPLLELIVRLCHQVLSLSSGPDDTPPTSPAPRACRRALRLRGLQARKASSSAPANDGRSMEVSGRTLEAADPLVLLREHATGDLLLKATGGVAIALVSLREWKWRQPGVVACFAIDRHRILRKHRAGVKEGSMMLAAVETVTKTDPVRAARCHKSDVAAKATTRESVHAVSPLGSTGRYAAKRPLDQGRTATAACGLALREACSARGSPP